MKVKVTWDEFVEAAGIGLRQKGIIAAGFPEFYQTHGYEPDSQCYIFPPAYVEIEVKSLEGVRLGDEAPQ